MIWTAFRNRSRVACGAISLAAAALLSACVTPIIEAAGESIGEACARTAIPVTTTDEFGTLVANPTDGVPGPICREGMECTLRAAIETASFCRTVDNGIRARTIILEPGATYGLTDVDRNPFWREAEATMGPSILPPIHGELTIRGGGIGPSDEPLSIIRRSDSAPEMRLFNVPADQKLILAGVIVAKGVSEKGGAVNVDGELVVNRVEMVQNIAPTGAAIYVNGTADAAFGVRAGSIKGTRLTLDGNVGGNVLVLRGRTNCFWETDAESCMDNFINGLTIRNSQFGNIVIRDGRHLIVKGENRLDWSGVTPVILPSKISENQSAGFAVRVNDNPVGTGSSIGLLLENIQISNNGRFSLKTTEGSGGGTGAYGSGVLIANNEYVEFSKPRAGESEIRLENSTFSGNARMKFQMIGDPSSFSGISFSTVTMVDNGPIEWIEIDAGISVSNSIIAGNRGAMSCRAEESMGGAASVSFFNTIGETEGGCSFPISGDPQLQPLARNAGLVDTMTHMPRIGSPAIDANDCSATGVDQRGVIRPQGAACDLGAVERAPGD